MIETLRIIGLFALTTGVCYSLDATRGAFRKEAITWKHFPNIATGAVVALVVVLHYVRLG